MHKNTFEKVLAVAVAAGILALVPLAMGNVAVIVSIIISRVILYYLCRPHVRIR